MRIYTTKLSRTRGYSGGPGCTEIGRYLPILSFLRKKNDHLTGGLQPSLDSVIELFHSIIAIAFLAPGGLPCRCATFATSKP